MADYQYTPYREGHVAQLTQSLIELDCGYSWRVLWLFADVVPDDAILNYQVPPLSEEFVAPSGEGAPYPFFSLAELQPTPIMSHRHLPFMWK